MELQETNKSQVLLFFKSHVRLSPNFYISETIGSCTNVLLLALPPGPVACLHSKALGNRQSSGKNKSRATTENFQDDSCIETRSSHHPEDPHGPILSQRGVLPLSQTMDWNTVCECDTGS